MRTTSQYDVVIVGGGVVGSAIAYFLTATDAFTGSILVVEKDPSYARCTTARSVGGIRQQFSTPENIRMSQFCVDFIRHVDEYLSVDDEAPALSFVEHGYLFLATEPGREVLASKCALQQSHGVAVALLEAADLSARFPWLNVDDLAAGSLGLSNEGWIDPYALLQGFRRKARAAGVVYLEDEVVGFERSSARVSAVRLKSGNALSVAAVVNASGPRAAETAATIGLELPVRPRKRQVFVFNCREPISDCPLLVDPSGMYLRPEGPNFLCGRSPSPDNDPDSHELEPDYELFEDELWPLLANRVPAFEAVKLVNAWACRYAYNVVDQNAIIGPHPEVENFYLANGFSGHGLQQSPAVGRAVSELIVFGAYRTLDLSRFGFDRIAKNQPIRELIVV